MDHEMRSRLRASPPANYAPNPQSLQPRLTTQPRYPPRSHDHLDGDERKAAAQPGHLRHSLYYPGGLKLSSSEWKLLGGTVVLAFFVRLYALSHPNSVVFDEVHFGKFAGKYIRTRYYVDVHPPLAKLLITLMAFLFGFDGEFDFKDIGKIYEAGVPYVAMRALPAIMGVAVVPLSYLTLRALDCRTTTALLGSLFITFENGLVTQSRLILLDSPLIFFTALSTFFWVGFSNEDRAEPFTDSWWIWLTLTGLSLGAVASCKWVGLFTIATIGVCTIKQLWDLMGDLRVSPRLWWRHFLARALCLIVVPVLFYMSIFTIHFAILQNPGDGDGFMSSEFQHTLNGRGMADTFADVSLGSEITIRHLNTQGGYLHSHAHNYPGGSSQQQITLYPHRDDNNKFRIVNITTEGDHDPDWATADITHVTPGMTIRLEHMSTAKRLHSHDVRPPVSEVDFQNEVSGYGFPGFVGDANDNWVVEIVNGEKSDKLSWTRLRTLRTKFRLRHSLTGCYLFSHKVKLPEWGFEQQEVTCNKNAILANSLWYVETNEHPRLPANADKVNYRLPGFFGKFWELQQVMWTTNAGLTDRHSFDSRPHSWPTLKRGINFWVKDHRQIYLIGNPVVWWLSTLAVVMYAAARGFLILRAKRGYQDFNNTTVVKYDQVCGFFAVGWFLHYFPFFLMSRQLFLHHYFPALYFAILLSASVFDLFTHNLKPKIRLQAAGVLLLLALWSFSHFSPLTYGNKWTKQQCLNSKWVKTWDFACGDFYNNLSDYSSNSALPSTPTASAIVAKPDGGNEAPAGDAHSTESVNQPVEPGRDIFQEKAEKDQPKTSIVAAPIDHQAIRDQILQASKAAESSAAAGMGNAYAPLEGVEAPPPLPPREQKDLTTEQKEPPAAQATIQTAPAADAKSESSTESKQGQSSSSSDSGAKQEQTSSSSSSERKQEQTSSSTASKELTEEERVRQELFPEEA